MSERPPSICLHVGAHKTATTHLQNSLAEAGMELAEAGVLFYGPRDFRGPRPTLQALFRIGNRPQDEKPLDDPDVLARLMQGGHRLILSEENFAGTLLNGFGRLRRPLYPDLPRRLRLLAARSLPLDVTLGIRDPAALLNSAFSQLLQSERPLPLRDYLAKNGLDLVDWADLARRILAVDGVRSLTIWRQEDYGQMFDRICRRLTGPGAPAVRPIPVPMHQGMSAAAVKALLADPTLPYKEAETQFPRGPDNPGFDAFDDADHALSAEYYAVQLDELDAMPRLTRLKPT